MLPALAVSCVEKGKTALGREGFSERCRRAAEAAAEAGSRSVRGADGDWFFLARELRHLGMGDLRAVDWSSVAANGQDPVPFIERFRDLLRERGVELLLVPVPPKAAVYPEKLFDGARPGDATPGGSFLEDLAARGIATVDLEVAFAGLRGKGGEKLYCAQDTHWSPLGCETAAQLIYEAIEDRPWLRGAAKTELVRSEATTIGSRGDLADEESGAADEEKLRVRFAGRQGPGGTIAALPPGEESPVLLLGDSHVLVFHEGSARGMHCDRAGLADHLQFLLGFPIDVVGVRGSGLVAARRELLEHASRIEGYWEKKRLLIWCFASREFTQSEDTLLDIPLLREKAPAGKSAPGR